MIVSNPVRTPTLLAIGLTLFSLVASARADDDDRHSRDFIQVSGTGKAAVAPDKADLNLSVEVQAKSAETARNQAADAMAGLIKTVKKSGVLEKDIQTRTVSLYPLYAPNSSNKISGYRLVNQVNLVVRDLGKLSGIIDSAVSAAGNAVRVQGIAFGVDKPDNALSEAREKAFADARLKAQQYAGLAGVKLGRVRRIGEGGSLPPAPLPYAEMSALKMSGGADVSTPIQAGEQEVSVTVDVVFAIE